MLSVWVSRDLRAGAFLAIGVSALLVDTGVAPWPIPSPRRQVPPHIFSAGHRRAGFLFGLQMGAGMVTYITAAAPYTIWVATGLGLTSLTNSLALGIGFGFGRGLLPFARLGLHRDDGWMEALEVFAARARWAGSSFALVGTTVAVLLIG